MVPRSADSWLRALPVLAAGALLVVLAGVWVGRLWHPFDLEWMEGGMLAHAWRIQRGLPLYGPPSGDFAPFIYPPGYPALVALLGRVTGLTMPLGRGVSLLASVAAAGAVVFVLRHERAPWWLAGSSGVVFLGTYPQAGAFYDLVRPDALGVALMGWAVAIGLMRHRWAPLVAGLLLAGAVLVKHNLGGVLVPMTLALALRSPRAAGLLLVGTVVPVAAVFGGLQLTSSGGFLTYLLEVPLSHPVRWRAGLVDSARDQGMALPVALAALGLAAVGLAVTRQRSLPTWMAAGVPAWTGALLGWWVTYVPPPDHSEILNVAAGVAAFAWGAGLGGVGVLAVGIVADRVRGEGEVPSWRLVYGVGVCATVALLAWSMRAHQGGFVNVHAPLYWVATVGLGVVAVRLERVGPTGRSLAALVLTAQLGWSLDHVDRDRLVPTAADVQAGWRVVRELRGIEGPVLSPFASWLPTYAGKEPSVHAMALWDVDHPEGPFVDDLSEVDRAFREHRWEVVLGGTQGLLPSLPEHYRAQGGGLFGPDDDALMPQTGWMARPERVLVPREQGW